MKLGVRAHDYGKRSVEEMAALLHDEGYGAAQLVLPKAFMGIESYGDITPEKVKKIRSIFESYEIDISVLGCYMDLGNPDKEVRKTAVSTLKQCLYWGKELGAGVVGTETAYPHLNDEQKRIWRPYMMDSLEQVLAEAQNMDMKLAIEPVYWHPLCDLEVVKDVVSRMDDPRHLRMIFDASNLLEYPDSTNQETYWEEWLEAIGEYVDVMHIKDFSLGRQNTYQPEALGEGVMEYASISRWLRCQEREIPLIREEMNPLFAKDDLEFMRKIQHR